MPDRLKLPFACGIYDRMEALRSGAVRPDGIDLQYIAVASPREIFDRMGRDREFDLAEFSSSEFVSRFARSDDAFVALPVFPSRLFRHSYIDINTNAGIRAPKDLDGKRVGVPLYTQTAAVWIRGILAHQYGVDLSTIRWVEGAMDKPGAHGDPVRQPLLEPVLIERNDSGRSLAELLADGKLDAVIGTRRSARQDHVAPLFADAKAVERAFYRETRIFPIMHLVVIRRDVYERAPWIADSLCAAFVLAKDQALARMRRAGALPYMLPWLQHDMAELDELFDSDPWPYGVEANRPTLQALVQYMAEQHLIAKAMPIEQLFVPHGGKL